MLSIFICEDDLSFLSYIKKEVERHVFDEVLTVKIEKSKIICFMTEPDIKHAVIVYTTDGDRMVFSGSLRKVESLLSDMRFYRCQKNLIVNIEKIIAIDPVSNELVLENDISIYVPYRQTKKLIERVERNRQHK